MSDAPLPRAVNNDAPILMQWDGEAFRPHRRHYKRIDAEFVVGEIYAFVLHEDRSAKSHRHMFACVNEAWTNLPEHLAERFQTADALRKYALIKAGYADHRQLVASSRAEALRLAAFVKPLDEYALVLVDDRTVNVWTAQSQSVREMGKARFQASKEGVLSILAEMVGVSQKQLSDNAEQAA